MAGDLSGGEQQMLALGGALMTKPELLMIDELSLGLAPTIVGQLLEVVREIHRRGTTIVIVEQSVNVALNLAERAVFMEKGEVRFEGPTAELLERPDILRSVFIAGANATHAAEEVDSPDIDKAAEMAAKRVIPADAKVDARVPRRGEALRRHHRRRRRRPRAARRRDPRPHRPQRRRQDDADGLHLGLPRDRRRAHPPARRRRHRLGAARAGQGRRSAARSRTRCSTPPLTVAETIAVARERHLASRDMVAAAFQLPASYESELAVWNKVDELVELMGLDAFREKLTGELSTGSRRIVDLACILAQDPKVLMLDEPSGGVAQKETEALGPLLLRVREHTGCSILVIEHDMPLLRTICDRMVALELGGVIAEGHARGGARAPAGDRVLPRHRRVGDQPLRRAQARPEGRAEEASGQKPEADAPAPSAAEGARPGLDS